VTGHIWAVHGLVISGYPRMGNYIRLTPELKTDSLRELPTLLLFHSSFFKRMLRILLWQKLATLIKKAAAGD